MGTCTSQSKRSAALQQLTSFRVTNNLENLHHLSALNIKGINAYLQVLVRQVSTSVNPIDFKVRAGMAKIFPKVQLSQWLHTSPSSLFIPAV